MLPKRGTETMWRYGVRAPSRQDLARAKARLRLIVPFAPLLLRTAAGGLLARNRLRADAPSDQFGPIGLADTLAAAKRARRRGSRLRVHWPASTFETREGRAQFEQWHRGVIVAYALGRIAIERDDP